MVEAIDGFSEMPDSAAGLLPNGRGTADGFCEKVAELSVEADNGTAPKGFGALKDIGGMPEKPGAGDDAPNDFGATLAMGGMPAKPDADLDLFSDCAGADLEMTGVAKPAVGSLLPLSVACGSVLGSLSGSGANAS